MKGHFEGNCYIVSFNSDRSEAYLTPLTNVLVNTEASYHAYPTVNIQGTLTGRSKRIVRCIDISENDIESIIKEGLEW